MSAPSRARRGAALRVALAALSVLTFATALGAYKWYYGRRAHVTAAWSPAIEADLHSKPGTAPVHSVGDVPLESLTDRAILFRVQGDAPGDYFGWSVAALGDVDGDGVADFAVGGHQLQNSAARPNFDLPEGYVRVFSGADARPLHTLRPAGSQHIDSSDDMFGVTVVGLDDLDGDGADDLAVGAFLYDFEDPDQDEIDENTGAIQIHSGATGERLELLGGERWGDRFGFALDVMPDVDGDGKRELLVGVEKAETADAVKNAGRTEIWSTGSLEPLATADGPGWEGRMGHSVAALGDVDGDGVADFASGAYMFGARQDADIQRGAVGVFSGKDGALLRAFEGADQLDNLGAAVTGLRGPQGAPHIALGATEAGYEAEFTGRYEGPGYVRIHDARTGDLLARIAGDQLGDQLGWALAGAGDLDGGGAEELLVGAPAGMTFLEDKLDRSGRMYLIGGEDQRVLRAFEGLSANDQFGAAVALLDDLDGDGLPEVLVGAPQNTAGQTEPGYAIVLRGSALLPTQ